ncbi:MAG: hypothetical protein E6Q57_14760 [Mycobacterium sp.]|nr:MAG: hypothetical protein E6Q57_14760 [Mycobacterium sp.]
MDEHTIETTLEAARRLTARGEHLGAYDLIETALGEVDTGDMSDRIRHLRALVLARAGSDHGAADALTSSGLEARIDELPADLAEDVLALRARLSKDRAFRTGDREALSAAARAYEAAADRVDRPYTTVNAATLWALAGERGRSERLARRARTLVDRTDDETYWSAAIRAEAALVLGDLGAAATALSEAGRRAGGDRAARASTTRQLRRLCDARDVDPAILTSITNPAVLHFTGHMALPGGRLDPSNLEAVGTAVSSWVESNQVSGAWGSLACGGDLIITEALLDRGVGLHIVLPFSVDEFVDVSVRPGGEQWVERFHRCLASAESVMICCDSPFLGDDDLFTYASRVAMGEARRRSVELDADAVQLAIWDGRGGGDAGTGWDVAAWRSSGGTTVVIPPDPDNTEDAEGAHVRDIANAGRDATAFDTASDVARREVMAVLFGDLQGVSRLHDDQYEPFVIDVLGHLGSILDRHDDAIVRRNSWGDAVFIAFRDAPVAARVALELQEAIGALDLDSKGLPEDFLLRLAAHAGPVWVMADPIRGDVGLFGRELTRAARIEPRTPPGEVYATRQFAALVALEGDGDILTEYVGHLTTAREFETVPMFVLKRASG